MSNQARDMHSRSQHIVCSMLETVVSCNVLDILNVLITEGELAQFSRLRWLISSAVSWMWSPLNGKHNPATLASLSSVLTWRAAQLSDVVYVVDNAMNARPVI